jgi:hypothetical protein
MSSDYPKSRLQARHVAAALKDHLDQLSPATELATVADTSFLLTQGYVTASSRKGPLTVIGCPIASVVPGTDIFVRKLANTGINQYVYDGLVTPTLVGSRSYAIMSADGVTRAGYTGTSTGNGAWSGATAASVVPTNVLTTGWYWSFFFYMTALPSPTSPITLTSTNRLQLVGGTYNPDLNISILYNYLGQIGLQFYSSGVYTTAYASQAFAPGKVWFLQLHLGNGLSVNGQTGSSLTLSNIGSLPAPIQNNIVHEFLGGSFGNTAPIGTWVSKFGFGYFPLGSFPYPINSFIPTSNSQIAQGTSAFGVGLTTYDRLLISDASGTTLPNTGTGAASGTATSSSAIITIGPY